MTPLQISYTYIIKLILLTSLLMHDAQSITEYLWKMLLKDFGASVEVSK